MSKSLRRWLGLLDSSTHVICYYCFCVVLYEQQDISHNLTICIFSGLGQHIQRCTQHLLYLWAIGYVAFFEKGPRRLRTSCCINDCCIRAPCCSQDWVCNWRKSWNISNLVLIHIVSTRTFVFWPHECGLLYALCKLAKCTHFHIKLPNSGHNAPVVSAHSGGL